MVQKLAIMFSYECAFLKIRKRKERKRKLQTLAHKLKNIYTHTIDNILI